MLGTISDAIWVCEMTTAVWRYRLVDL